MRYRCNKYYSVSNENFVQKGEKVDFENPKVRFPGDPKIALTGDPLYFSVTELYIPSSKEA